MRALMAGAICAPVMLPFFLLSAKEISNVYALMVLKMFLPTFAASFLLYCGLFEYIFVKIEVLSFSHQAGSLNDDQFEPRSVMVNQQPQRDITEEYA